jgi:hypothetical protein
MKRVVCYKLRYICHLSFLLKKTRLLLFIYLWFVYQHSVAQTIWCRMIGKLSNGEFGTVCRKKQPWANLWYYPGICVEGLRTTNASELRLSGKMSKHGSFE